MLDLSRIYKKIYVAYLELTDNHKILKFTMHEINNEVKINEQIELYKTKKNIYWLNHWFDNIIDCQKYIDLMNKNPNITMVDYYKHRFNITERFVLYNKRKLQKMVFYIKKFKGK